MKTIFKRIYWRQCLDRSRCGLLSLVLLFFYSTTSLADPTAFSCSQVTDIPQTECEALVVFYDQTDGEHWLNHSGWLSETTAGNWYGVTVTNGQVTELKLDDNHLVGTLPTELCQLTQLQVLNLGHYADKSNQLTGNLSPCLGKLIALRILSLGSNQFTGELPSELGNLTQLTYLELRDNALTGILPETLCNLTQLEEAYFGYNQKLTAAEIPHCIGEQWHNLKKLDFGATRRTGTLPISLCNLTKLENLGLGSNQLIGEIPSCLGNLSNLRSLGLNTNQLTGQIPDALCKAPLSYLGLFSNQLTGQIPACLGQLNQLHLDNNQLESPLHENFVKQVLANPKLIQLTLAKNNFGLGDCQAIHAFIARGGWADKIPGGFTQGLLHSPQNDGFDFEVDCASLSLHVLTVTKTGDGSGTITGNGINCGTDCVDAYQANTPITLTATPDTNSIFTGWSGNCQGTDATTTLTLTSDQTCNAQFELKPLCQRVTDITLAECNTLLTLYQSTNGPNWIANTGWNQTDTPCRKYQRS